MTYNFETNIELRMPDTGKVYAIQRMTSEWAERNTFDVDAFVSDVAQRHGADIERVRTFFNYGLGRMGERFSTHCPAKHTDRVVKDPKTGIGQWEFGKFPDYVNGCEPALIEAWNKGAEYHTKGFRMGDVLPSRVPMTKITRVGDGWIALFPKEMGLTDSTDSVAVDGTVEGDTEGTGTSVPSADAGTARMEPVPPVSPAAAEVEPEPVVVAPQPTERERNAAARRRRREQREAQQRSYEERIAREAQEAEEYARQQERRKIFAAIGAAAVTLTLIYFFGLLGPAVFGLLAGGLLKG